MRRRAPHVAVVLLTPIDQTCVRGLKRMKPFAAVPRDAAGTAQILERCYSNATVSAAFEAVGRAPPAATSVADRAALVLQVAALRGGAGAAGAAARADPLLSVAEHTTADPDGRRR